MRANFNKIVQQNVDEELFCQLIASVKDYAIFMVDPNGYILSWNVGAENINGYTEAQVIRKHIAIFYTPEDIAAGEPQYHLAEALKQGKYENEGWRVRKDGSRFWANVVFTPIYNTNHQHIGFGQVVQDVTRRKQTADEQELIQAELAKRVQIQSEKILATEIRFSKLIEHSYDGISLLDEKFRVFYRSRSAERISGWNDAERVKVDILDLTHPDDMDMVAELLPKILAEPGKTNLINFRSKHKDGHYMWLECLYTNMLEDKDIQAIVCNFRDISSRINAQKEINNKSQQIENILDRITDGFVALDNDLKYTYANKQVGEMVGKPPEDLIGRYIWDLFPEAVGSKTYRAIMRAHKYQYYVHNEDFYEPMHLWQENHIYPSAEGLSIFIRDISERKISEHQLSAQHLQIKEAANMQSAVLNALPPHIALLNDDGIILNVNDSWKRFSLNNHLHVPDFGIGSSYYAICHQVAGVNNTESKNIARGIKAVLAGRKKEYLREYPCHTATEKRWFQLVAAPLADHKQKGVVVLHVNITARKLAEESLLRSQANLRSVFENTDQSIVLFDTDLKIVAYNNNARELSVAYFKRKMRVGSSAFKYFPADRQNAVKHFTDQAKNGQTVSYEVSYDFTARTQWFEVKWVGINDARNQNVGIILTIKDITTRKRQENEINRQNEALREVAWLSSHEIRRPVASILGLVNLFQLSPESTEREEMVELINQCAKELDGMVHQIHDKIKDGDSV